MNSTHETGHGVNVANLQKLINLCVALGALYVPVKSSLQVPQLTALYNAAVAALQSVIDAGPPVIHAINQRIEINTVVKPLSTRLVNALDATDASDLLIADARTINRKIQGARKITTVDTPLVEGQEPPTQAQISVSQQSFVQRLEHFKQLRALLISEPSYTPAEAELQDAALMAQITSMENANNAVDLVAITLANARIARNEILYNKQTGLVAMAAEVKKYVKSIFGASSPQYKQFSALKFTYSR